MLFQVTDDGLAKRVTPVRTTNERRELQTILARNPSLLPGEQIDPDSPRRWLLVREEMPVPDPGGGGARWSVDLILSDQSGIPTFVECKRYADTRARREVVGQMLEYAANGHYYWDRAQIRGYIEDTAERAGISAEAAFGRLGSEDFEDLEELVDQFVENLREGQVRLVFFMEEAPQELKSIVDFLNRQTERTEVLIVQAKQFDVGGQRFIVPSLFGYTEEARRAKRAVTVTSGQKRRRWTEKGFFEELAEELGSEEVSLFRRVLAAAREENLEVRWGTGRGRGSFNLVSPGWCTRSFATFRTDGEISINLGWLNGTPKADRLRVEVSSAVQEELGLEAKGTEVEFWGFRPSEWNPRGEALVPFVRRIGALEECDPPSKQSSERPGRED